uniref:Uncharacterized protein n=1 Tax=Fagus sylvatica TaxID=28930 RepID=A0A2N9GIH9_FAGSY
MRPATTKERPTAWLFSQICNHRGQPPPRAKHEPPRREAEPPCRADPNGLEVVEPSDLHGGFWLLRFVVVDGAEHAILGPSSRKWWNFPIRLMMLLTDTWSTPNCSIRANTTSRRIGNGYLTFFVGKEKERQLISKEPRMVGRGAEMEKLLDLLIEGDPQLAIISIVGEAGLGKTTLAAEAYNSVYVKNYFDCRARVHVSSKSTANEILKMMLFSYNDLPDYLKPCLLYFAIFPEDSKVSTRQLFQLWIAEGFIHENFEATAEVPSGIPESTLGDLQFLSLLNASSCSVDVLSRMTNLQTLRIYGDLGSHHEALSVNLSRLSCLKSLRLVGNKPAKFLGEYKFPSSLTHLTLLSTELKDDPMPTLENLPMLLVLKLKHNSYSGRKLACTTGKFPCLQVLHLKSMQWLEEWTMEPGAMPELVSLVINPCAYLRRLPEELWRVKTFCKLELWWPRLELKPKLREFEDMDQYDIQIHPSGL